MISSKLWDKTLKPFFNVFMWWDVKQSKIKARKL